MGIPRLTTTLQPFASPARLDGSKVVIDGPALAYHIIHLCEVENQPNGLARQPTPTQLGQKAIAWLDQFSQHDIEVCRIFFDGSLPESKFPTRLERTCRTSKTLRDYFLSHPAGIPMPSSNHGSNEPSELSANHPRKKGSIGNGRPLPIPFGVQIIFEALRQSKKYGERTMLVDGEADPYCADFARAVHGKRVLVLTSDSDLLLFDLGSAGKVIFFRDIEMGSDVDSKGLVALMYSTSRISRILSQPPEYGLSSLAFELSRDPHLVLNTLLDKSKRAVAISAHPDEYVEFIAQYQIRGSTTTASSSRIGDANWSDFDSRVSELVMRCCGTIPRFEMEDSCRPAASGVKETMFLPQLLDSWSLTTAWETSVSIRKIAYGLLQYVARLPTVVEYRRVVTLSSSGTAIEVPPLSSVDELRNDFLSLVSTIRAGITVPGLEWVILATHEDIAWSRRADKESVVLHILREETDPGGILDTSSWNVVHWLAQVRATYYSLRILKQMVVFIGREISRGHIDPPPEGLDALSSALRSLPSFEEYPSLCDMRTLPGRVSRAGGLRLLGQLAGLSEPIELGSSRRRGTGKEARLKKRTSRQQPLVPSKRANPFSVLESE